MVGGGILAILKEAALVAGRGIRGSATSASPTRPSLAEQSLDALIRTP